MDFTAITVAIADGVAELTLNRPQALNSLNKTLIDETRVALGDLEKNSDVRAVLLTGAGRGFCAGADLANGGFPNEEKRSPGEQTAHSMLIGFNPLVHDLAHFPKPVVTAVNGVAAGGGVGLALCGDVVLAAKSAYFVMVFGPRLALVPDMGVTWFAPRLIGHARSRAMALLGERIPAEKAAQWGMIWDAVDDDKLMSEARALAARLAKGPREAFKKIKEVLDASLDNTLDQQLELERLTQGKLGDLPDTREGVIAFLQKRDPAFK
ncbi:MAG: enoyl-CoA hydratase/isomerase family protein [Alphaproteobacteria bacterium]|nr:enoyl-CoA hydratase/isomerase family protein [Alphaproteobacteria bacterium]